MRVISLIASATEIVCALRGEKDLVGRSHECDFPPSVLRLPVCTEPKFKVQGTSAEIHERVQQIVRQALSVYRVDGDRLRELRPDVIVTQTHCEVCAVSLKDVEQAACQWIDSQPRIVALAPNALADLWQDIRLVADALGIADRGEEVIGELQRRMQAIADVAQKQPARPTVACIEWIDPLMSAGNWMPELVDLAGGVCLFGKAGEHSPRLAWEEVVAANPDAIFVMPCGWDIAKSREEMPALTSKPEWPGLAAVQAGRVYLTDGNQYFNRPGPRLVESLEILAEVLHPQAFPTRHRGTGWQSATSCE